MPILQPVDSLSYPDFFEGLIWPFAHEIGQDRLKSLVFVFVPSCDFYVPESVSE